MDGDKTEENVTLRAESRVLLLLLQLLIALMKGPLITTTPIYAINIKRCCSRADAASSLSTRSFCLPYHTRARPHSFSAPPPIHHLAFVSGTHTPSKTYQSFAQYRQIYLVVPRPSRLNSAFLTPHRVFAII